MSGSSAADQRALLERALRQLRDARQRIEAAERAEHEPIAIVGGALRLPGGAGDLDAFWQILRDGVDAVSPLVSTVDGKRRFEEPVDDGHCAGLLSEVDGFDAEFFGISAGEAERMDPQQRLVLETAWEAVEDAGLPLDRLKDCETGVYLGVYGNDYLTLQLGDPAGINAYTAPGGAHSVAANRLSYLFDLSGPSLALDTACSSSLVAVHLACRALRSGECDMALVGGVNVILSPLSTLVTERVLPMASSGRCRSFDASADGMVRSEGCGILLLERISRAQAADHRVRALIRGTAINHDGRTNGLTAPNPRAQARLFRQALSDAQAKPEEVVYVEAHGTGTALGDPIEVEAVREIYGVGDTPCALGSAKTNLGHPEAAAGVAGLLKAMLVLEHGEVPMNVHLERLNPEIRLDGTRLVIPSEGMRLPEPAGRPLAAVNSFGFGGANAHVLLERAPAPAEQDVAIDREHLLLPISARSEGALRELAEAYRRRIDGRPPAEVAELCAAAAVNRSHHSLRACLTATGGEALDRQLRAVGSVAALREASAPPRVGFVFSGQGSQWLGMGRDLLASSAVFRAEIEACGEIVSRIGGWSLVGELNAREGQSRLHETEVAQLAIAALQLALAVLWRSWGVEPYGVVGHSMGEVVAACASGALSRDDAFELLLARAQRAEQGARGGAMASVALPLAEVEELVATVPGTLGIAASNGPESTVVSGELTAVEELVAAASGQGAAVKRLPVEYAFHSPLLEQPARDLARAVRHIMPREPECALYSTVTGGRARREDLDGEHWARNLREKVALQAAVAAMAHAGVSAFIEVGPHPVLLRDIDGTLEREGVDHLVVGSLRAHEPASQCLDRSLADLYRAGLDIEWESVFGPVPYPVSLPLYPWQRKRYWLPVVADAMTGVTPAAASETNGDGHPSAAPDHAPADPASMTAYVRERIAEALGASGADQVPADAPLDDLGLTSLAIVELKNQVERELGIGVTLEALLDAGTPAGLGEALSQALALARTGGAVDPAPASGEVDAA